MKICFVIDNIYFLGGAQRCTALIANELVKRNYDVTIVCIKNASNESKIDYNLSAKVKVLNITMKSFFQKVLSIWTKPLIYINNKTNLLKNKAKLLEKMYYTKSKKGLKELETIVNQEKYDVVIGVTSFLSVFITFLKIDHPCKLIGWQHSTSERYFELPGQFLWHQDGIVKEAMQKLDKYLVLTQYDKKYLKEKYNYDVEVMYNPCSFESKKTSSKKDKVVLSVGRYEKVKGYDLLIKAFALVLEKHPDWSLKLVGEGSEENNLKELVRSLGLDNKVILTGKSKDLTADYLNSAIFVLSSRMEGWGIVITEAMEFGLPIVSFDLPCVHEIITSDEGIIAKYLDVADLAKAINTLIENADLRNKLGNNGKKRVKKFSIDNIIKEWEKVLNEKNN